MPPLNVRNRHWNWVCKSTNPPCLKNIVLSKVEVEQTRLRNLSGGNIHGLVGLLFSETIQRYLTPSTVRYSLDKMEEESLLKDVLFQEICYNSLFLEGGRLTGVWLGMYPS